MPSPSPPSESTDTSLMNNPTSLFASFQFYSKKFAGKCMLVVDNKVRKIEQIESVNEYVKKNQIEINSTTFTLPCTIHDDDSLNEVITAYDSNTISKELARKHYQQSNYTQQQFHSVLGPEFSNYDTAVLAGIIVCMESHYSMDSILLNMFSDTVQCALSLCSVTAPDVPLVVGEDIVNYFSFSVYSSIYCVNVVFETCLLYL
jgi:hypothetical protein